ncbi:MAG: polyphosphate kinase 2 [Candidatus Neomarinimicrobiota bacterium]|nr:MAG: polyphosphate kinase 2 [Candidatus Neomarinimicrobiota bacterium]
MDISKVKPELASVLPAWDGDPRLKKALRYLQQTEELKPYQVELIKLQKHLERYQKKMIICFDGRDASGKGGTIRRVTRYMNAKHYRVVALGPPNQHQKTELYMKRYVEHFPHAGEIVLFDRSWYNRALVEPVLGFCTPKQYKSFLKHVNSYEENFLDDDKTILIKLYFSVSKKEQKRRFKARKTNPLKQWKLSEVDLQAQKLWDEFTEKKFKMLKKTHTPQAPWWIIRSNNKHLARLETMKVILNSVRYRGRNRELDFTPNPKIVRTGDQEIKIMKREKKKHGKPIS